MRGQRRGGWPTIRRGTQRNIWSVSRTGSRTGRALPATAAPMAWKGDAPHALRKPTLGPRCGCARSEHPGPRPRGGCSAQRFRRPRDRL